MNFGKIKSDEYCRGVVVHVERLGEWHKNKNIDPSLSSRNYSLTDGHGIDIFNHYQEAFQTIASQQKRRVRSDAVRVVDFVCQLPEQYKEESEERQRAFFEAVRDKLSDDFGELLWATVHRDEKTKEGKGADHLHAGFIPVTRDGRLSAKEVISEEVLARYHDEMDAYLKERLPWYHGGIVEENKNLRHKGKAVSMSDYKAVKEEVDKVRAERDQARAELVKAQNQIRAMAQTFREKEADYSASLQQAEEKGGIASDLLSRKLAGERLTRAEKKAIKRDLWGYGLRRTEVETQLRHDEAMLEKRESDIRDGFTLIQQEEKRQEEERQKLIEERDRQQEKERELQGRERAVRERESSLEIVFQKVKALVRFLFSKDRTIANKQEVKDIEKFFGRKIITDTEKMMLHQTHERGDRSRGGMER